MRRVFIPLGTNHVISSFEVNKSKNLLVVDDDLAVREALTQVLQSEEYQVSTAASSKDALNEFNESDFDIVLLDLNLGTEDGWEVFHAFKQRRPELPIVLTSAESDRLAHSSGGRAAALLVKPFDMTEMLRVLSAALFTNAESKVAVNDAPQFQQPRLPLRRRQSKYSLSKTRSNLRNRFNIGALLLLGFCFPQAVRSQALSPAAPLKIDLRTQNGNSIVSWPAGVTANPVQLQSAPAPNGPWQNIGSPTTGTSITTPMAGPSAFYRVLYAGNTLSGDRVAPSVNLTSPSSGSTLSSTVTLTANATDNVGGSGVARVEFYSDGSTLLGAANAAPYNSTVNTTIIPNGTHTLSCKAYDAAGNSSTSTANQVTVNNSVTVAGQCLLQRSFGGTEYAAGAVIKSSVVDRSGNLIVVGLMYYTVDFGAGAMSSVGGQDVFVAKYAPNGQCLWSRLLGNGSNDSANGVAVDSSGNILVTGGISGFMYPAIMDFGFGPVQCLGGGDVFLIKYSSAGAILWSKVFGGSGSDVATAIAVDASDNILLTGTHGFFGTGIDFGGGALPTYGQQDVFITKLNSSGGYIWARSYGGSDSDAVTSMAVDGSGNPVIAGQFRGTANFGSGNVISAGDTDGYVGKYSGADGSNLWFKRLAGTASQSVNGVAVDGSGNVVITGDFTGTVDFGGALGIGSLGGSIYVAKYNVSGVLQWSKTFGAEINGPHVAGVAVDGSGRVIVTGEMITGIDFGTGWLLGQGGNDAFVVKLDTNATVLWAKRGSPYGDSGLGVTIDRSNNNIFVSGSCGTAGVDFGSQTVITTPNTLNNSFFLKISP